MKIAIIGSRNIEPENLGDYLPKEVSEIVSGQLVVLIQKPGTMQWSII